MVVFFVTLITLLVSSASVQNDLFGEISTAISDGNATTLSTHFNSSLELKTPDNQGIYSQSQAGQILHRFFEKYPPVSFKFQHYGNSSAGARFAVGSYQYGNNERFRVSVFIKKNGNNYRIHEIKFD